MELNLDLLRGAALVLLIVAFLALWAWAWSGKRKADFERLSRMPLEEDAGDQAADDAARKP